MDLAGSERIYKLTSAETTRREGRSINLSLHYLEQVILALHDRSRGVKVHIPYRNSLMTSVLRDSLGGTSRTVFITTLNTEAEFADESMSTCRYHDSCVQCSVWLAHTFCVVRTLPLRPCPAVLPCVSSCCLLCSDLRNGALC